MPKRAFIGKAVPVGWDYAREDVVGVPNPVFENIVGLLLSYDELWFPGREFCPEDMRDLSYVRFVDEMAMEKGRALVAMEQVSDSPELRAFSREISEATDRAVCDATVNRFRSIPEFEIRLDNHSRGTSELGMGNSTEAGLWLEDVAMAGAMDVELDVIVNGVLASAINGTLLANDAVGYQSSANQIAFTEHVLGMHTVDFLTERGAYHPSMEDLRSRPSVAEFRNYVSEATSIDSDLVKLAKEVELHAAQHRDRVLTRFVKGSHRVESLGGPAIGIAGNLIQPGLGTLLRAPITANRWIQDRKLKRELPWALFKSYAETWRLQQDLNSMRNRTHN